MSEADYMDDCQQTVRYDEEKRPSASHEVKINNRIAFVGTRKSCWRYKAVHGGFVQPHWGDSND